MKSYYLLRDYSVCKCQKKLKPDPACPECGGTGRLAVVEEKQLGREPTVEAYIGNMVRVFDLMRDCLAPHGVVWCNIGDTYATGGGGIEPKAWRVPQGVKSVNAKRGITLAHGNLCLIPQRLALALQADGWIVRSVVAWTKPAPMPASLSGWAWRRCRVKVKAGWDDDHPHPSNDMSSGRAATCFDRGRKASSPQAEWADCPGCPKCIANDGLVLRKGSWRPTSSWEPILMLAKSATYFSDGEAVKTPVAPATVGRDKYSRILDDAEEQFAVRHDHETVCLTGANPRDNWPVALEDMTKEELIALIRNADQGEMPDTWSIASEALSERHYASFPTELVRRCLLASTSARGYCNGCGMPWVRVIDKPMVGTYHAHDAAGVQYGLRQNGGGPAAVYDQGKSIGWRPSCSCSPEQPTRPAVVLDPFCGSGRTGLVARKLGLDFVGVEVNPQYAAMAERLLREDAPLFAEKVALPQSERTLFDDLEEVEVEA